MRRWVCDDSAGLRDPVFYIMIRHRARRRLGAVPRRLSTIDRKRRVMDCESSLICVVCCVSNKSVMTSIVADTREY